MHLRVYVRVCVTCVLATVRVLACVNRSHVRGWVLAKCVLSLRVSVHLLNSTSTSDCEECCNECMCRLVSVCVAARLKAQWQSITQTHHPHSPPQRNSPSTRTITQIPERGHAHARDLRSIAASLNRGEVWQGVHQSNEQPQDQQSAPLTQAFCSATEEGAAHTEDAVRGFLSSVAHALVGRVPQQEEKQEQKVRHREHCVCAVVVRACHDGHSCCVGHIKTL